MCVCGEREREREMDEKERERERDCVHKLTTVPSLAASQMDGDHYVPISIVASFNQVYAIHTHRYL